MQEWAVRVYRKTVHTDPALRLAEYRQAQTDLDQARRYGTRGGWLLVS